MCYIVEYLYRLSSIFGGPLSDSKCKEWVQMHLDTTHQNIRNDLLSNLFRKQNLWRKNVFRESVAVRVWCGRRKNVIGSAPIQITRYTISLVSCTRLQRFLFSNLRTWKINSYTAWQVLVSDARKFLNNFKYCNRLYMLLPHRLIKWH